MFKGAQENLQELLEDNRVWALLATVDAVNSHSAWEVLLDVTFQPSGVPGQTRFKQLGSGVGQSASVGVSVGDEVLVVFPEGKINQGIALSGLVSKAAPLSAMESLLKADTFSTDFGKFLTALLTAFTTASADAVAVTTAGAFTTLLANPDFTSFLTNINAATYHATALKAE